MSAPSEADRPAASVQSRLEAAIARLVDERLSGTLAFEDTDGGLHQLAFTDGLDVVIRSSLVGDVARAGEAGDVAEALFSRTAGANDLLVDDAALAIDAGARPLAIDAFELLYRGGRARRGDADLARSIERLGAPLALHRDAALDAFSLTPAEQKIAKRLEALPRTFEDLAATGLLAEAELAAFLHFLLVTGNAFVVDAEPPDVAPIGQLTFEERERRQAAPEPDQRRLAVGGYGYALFGAALLPLAVSFASESDVRERLAATVRAHPELGPTLARGVTPAELFAALPGGRIDGALLAYDSKLHWLFALVSAAGFVGLLLGAIDRGRAKPRELVKVLLFTATIGTVLLFGVQLLAAATRGVWARGYGFGVALFYVVKMIGFSYDAANDPANGWFLSFIGFTCGVGLCEETIKALPVLEHFRSKGTLDLRGAISWGLASGIGFGVAEGVSYAGGHYNGFETLLAYAVRFTSCVALHAVWSASAATSIYTRRRELQVRAGVADRAVTLLTVIAVPMVLHGLYDTFLKRSLELPALATAIASFGYLLWCLKKSAVATPAPVPAA